MADWGLFNFRLSFFTTNSQSLSAPDLYRSIWIAEPDGYQRSQNALAPSSANGKRGTLMVQCSVQAGRVDLNFTGAMQEALEVKPPRISNIQDLSIEVSTVLGQIKNGVISPPIIRVACFVQFMNLQSSHAEANKVVIATIPSQFGVKTTNEEDFIFQINRPYKSRAIPDVKMNSIVKWSVERIQMMTITTDSPQAGPRTSEFTTASVTIDVNNAPRSTPINAPDQVAILNEAIEAADSIRKETGVPISSLLGLKEKGTSYNAKTH
jgi:hypothetical protein